MGEGDECDVEYEEESGIEVLFENLPRICQYRTLA